MITKNQKFIFITCLLASLSSIGNSFFFQDLKAQTSLNDQLKSNESWRKDAPKLAEPKSFKLPLIEKFKLANGLSVECVEDKRVPFTTIALGLKTGSSKESSETQGLSSLVVDMLPEGTKNKNSKEIAESIDFIGGAFSGASGADFTILSTSALSQYNEKLIELLSDLIINPTFPEDELGLKKANTVQELIMKRSRPDFLAEERFANVIFGSHPYSVVSPKPETIEKIERKQLIDFHKKNYFPNEATLVAVGNFKSSDLRKYLEKYFSSWKSGKLVNTTKVSLPKQIGKKIYLVDRPGSVQSNLKMGNIGLCRKDPDFFAMAVANQILGGAAGSRLFNNIRENKGYTYGAYSDSNTKKESGSFSAKAEVRSEVTSQALQEFLYELDRMRKLKVESKELEHAKKYLVGSYQLGLETQGGLAQRLLEAELYELEPNYLELYCQKIMEINPDEVRRVAGKYIDLDNLVITVVGDASKIRRDLEFFAPIAIFDTKGAMVKIEDPKTNATKQTF